MVARRFGIYLVSLDPTVGSEISKTRPCVVVSPDEMNRNIRTVIIAPMTTAQKRYPTRVPCKFGGRVGEIVLDQIRTVDQSRLVKELGSLDPRTGARVTRVLLEMFA
jgi:mRNA interferase MazF